MGLVLLSHKLVVAKCALSCCIYFLLKEGKRYVGVVCCNDGQSDSSMEEEIRRLLIDEGIVDLATQKALLEGAIHDLRRGELTEVDTLIRYTRVLDLISKRLDGETPIERVLH